MTEVMSIKVVPAIEHKLNRSQHAFHTDFVRSILMGIAASIVQGLEFDTATSSRAKTQGPTKS